VPFINRIRKLRESARRQRIGPAKSGHWEAMINNDAKRKLHL